MTLRLPAASFVSFPFRLGKGGPLLSGRSSHVREQIEQVLFTNPGERVFRPEFGIGVVRLVFEPNSTGLWAAIEKRLISTLSDALAGEVDPSSLEVQVGPDEGHDERLVIFIAYQLAAINQTERHRFVVSLDGEGGDG